jgi:hypothetical protein
MNTPIGLEKCFSFINCNLQPPKLPVGTHSEPTRFRAITISRQTGSGGHSVAEKLLERLQAREPQEARPWAIFDRNLVEKVLEDHKLPARLAKFMPENRVSEITDTMDELFGLHPPSWELVRKTSETILHLAQLEHVILIGRGANIITSRLSHVLHIRLVGSLEQRARRLQEVNQISAKEAARLAEREDVARRRYVKQFFGKEIDDPLLYHLVINTDLLSAEEVARMILLATAPASLAMAA